MGKKAKIRKERRKKTINHSKKAEINSRDFIRQVEKTGYRKENLLRSPEVPRNEIKPEI